MDEAAAALIASSLAGIDAKVDRLLESTSQHSPRISALERDTTDHEKRIRSLEERRWSRAGAVAAVSAGAGLVVAATALFGGHAPVFG